MTDKAFALGSSKKGDKKEMMRAQRTAIEGSRVHDRYILEKAITRAMLRPKFSTVAKAVLTGLACGGVLAIAISLVTDHAITKVGLGLGAATIIADWALKAQRDKHQHRLAKLREIFRFNSRLIWTQTTTNPAKPNKTIMVRGSEDKGGQARVPVKRWRKILKEATATGTDYFLISATERIERDKGADI
jgi:hypothetical protein